MEEFREQAKRFGAAFLTNWIRQVDLSQGPFKIVTDEQDLFKGQLEMDEVGYLKTAGRTMATMFRECSPAETCRTHFIGKQ